MRRGVASHDLAAWRDSARQLAGQDVRPEDVLWTDEGMLFEHADAVPARELRVPRAFVSLAERVLHHRSPARFDTLYRLLYRLTHGEPGLLEVASDRDVGAARRLAQAVARDEHKMKAFVRFRRVRENDYAAWYAPDHRVVRAVAPFFAERFSSMRWAIWTPDESVAWDGERLAFGPGVPRHAAPAPDELEDLWRTYYASIFNPARANPRALKQHMPARFWRDMPETALIPGLLAGAAARVGDMIAPGSASERFLPEVRTLPVLREAARGCTACELCQEGTRTVFGEGPATARIVVVGEQPGDLEDLAGRPFVGPAGQLLDDALRDAGLVREQLYLTNAVKHFHHEPRGPVRIHRKPESVHLRACRGWLDAELAALTARVIVCLGATAAQAFLGPKFRVQRGRGQVIELPPDRRLVATFHPAAILRAIDRNEGERQRVALVADLRLAGTLT